jgi:hypothetical protein
MQAFPSLDGVSSMIPRRTEQVASTGLRPRRHKRRDSRPTHRDSNSLDEFGVRAISRERPTPHQGIGQQVPVSGERDRARFAGSVTAIPVLGGLHHDYRAAA